MTARDDLSVLAAERGCVDSGQSSDIGEERCSVTSA
jgi:hypothetical protein